MLQCLDLQSVVGGGGGGGGGGVPLQVEKVSQAVPCTEPRGPASATTLKSDQGLGIETKQDFGVFRWLVVHATLIILQRSTNQLLYISG